MNTMNKIITNLQSFMRNITVFVFTVSFLITSYAYAAQSSKRVIRIGTGNKSAIAYPTMSSICDIFNKKNSHRNISCKAIQTGGSEENLKGIMSGKYDAGVIKADMEYDAYNGIGVHKGKPYRELRTVFGLHSEYLTILVKNGLRINSFKDFEGKRVYLGNEGSGSRVMVNKLLDANKWTKNSFKEVRDDPADSIKNLFCNNEIDAAIYLVGHPNKIFTETLERCDTKIIGFSRKEVEDYVDLFRYASLSKVNKRTYENQKQDISTLSSQLLLATSSVVDEEIIYSFVQIIAENYPEIQISNPILRSSDLFSSQISVIPLHKGTRRYFNSLH